MADKKISELIELVTPADADELAIVEKSAVATKKITYQNLRALVSQGAIAFIIDGGGSAITTGQKGHLEIPFKCEIERVTLLADQTGSIVIDIWKSTYADFPPTSANSICGTAKPTISAAQKSQDATLTDWTKTINAGDILAFNVDSVATITRVTLALKVKKVA